MCFLSLDHSGEPGTLAMRLSNALNAFDNKDSGNLTEDEDEDEQMYHESSAAFQTIRSSGANVNDPVELNQVDSVRHGVSSLRIKPGKTENHNLSVSFRDVEELIKPFSGDDLYTVEEWILQFQEGSEILQLSEIQKILFSRKSLKGNALLFIEASRGVTSYSRLSDLLKTEFSSVVNSQKCP